MDPLALTAEKRKGVKATFVVVMLVLVLFVLVLLAGSPILVFETKPLSVAYALVVYVPVMALCYVAYRRMQRSKASPRSDAAER